jgi:hypothetical protein
MYTLHLAILPAAAHASASIGIVDSYQLEVPIGLTKSYIPMSSLAIPLQFDSGRGRSRR